MQINQLIVSSENDIDAGTKAGQAQQVIYFESLQNIYSRWKPAQELGSEQTHDERIAPEESEDCRAAADEHRNGASKCLMRAEAGERPAKQT